jgi:hypothetical protein
MTVSNWAMLDNRWLCSTKSWLPPMSASPLFPPSLTFYSLIGQRPPDLPPLYACLGRNERLSLCSLEVYPLGVGRFITSGEPISKFDSGLWFVQILFRLRFVVSCRGQGCPLSQAVGARTNWFDLPYTGANSMCILFRCEFFVALFYEILLLVCWRSSCISCIPPL